jgi:hypothetical protein
LALYGATNKSLKSLQAEMAPPAGEDGAGLNAGATGIAVQGTPQAQTSTYPLFFTVQDFP